MSKKSINEEARIEFTHVEYLEILQKIGLTLKDYTEAAESDTFTVLRHDVEFSVARAHEMALIEHQLGVTSTFFFQAVSSAYNPFSLINKNLITNIKNLGHRVGLHFYVTHVAAGDWHHLEKELGAQRLLFETGLGLDCDRFSFHRPPRWVLENQEDEITGLINAYGKSFFEFSDQPQHIKYIADSKHRWSYGHPLDAYPQEKVQILIHPDEWSVSGGNTKQNFAALIGEHHDAFIDTLDGESKHFGEYRDDLK